MTTPKGKRMSSDIFGQVIFYLQTVFSDFGLSPGSLA